MTNPGEQPFSDSFYDAFEVIFGEARPEGVEFVLVNGFGGLELVGEPEERALGLAGLSSLFGTLDILRDARMEREAQVELAERLERNLYEATKSFGDYLVAEEIKDVVLIDRAARPAWTGINEYLRLAHPDAPRPKYHFVSPRMTEPFSPDFPELAQLFDQKSAETAAAQLASEKTSLLDNPDDPLVIFDACVHTGESMQGIQRVMQTLGRTDIRLAAFTDSESKSGRRVIGDLDFVFTGDKRAVGCKPYGIDEGLAKHEADAHVLDISISAEYIKRNTDRRYDRHVITKHFTQDQNENATL